MKSIFCFLILLLSNLVAMAQLPTPPTFSELKKFAVIAPQVTSADRSIHARGHVAVNPGLAADSLVSDSVVGYSSTSAIAARAEADAMKTWITSNLAYAQTPVFTPATDSTRARYTVSPGITTLPSVLHNCDLNFAGSGEYYLYAGSGLAVDSVRTFADQNLLQGSIVFNIVGAVTISNCGLVGTVMADSVVISSHVGGAFTVNCEVLAITGTSNVMSRMYTPNRLFWLSSVLNTDNVAFNSPMTYQFNCDTYTNGIVGNLFKNGNFENLNQQVQGRINYTNGNYPACSWKVFNRSITPDLYHTFLDRNLPVANCSIPNARVNIPNNSYGVTAAATYNYLSGTSEPIAGVANVVFFGNARESIYQELSNSLQKGKYVIGYKTAGTSVCNGRATTGNGNFINRNVGVSFTLTNLIPNLSNPATHHLSTQNFSADGVMLDNNTIQRKRMERIAELNFAVGQTMDERWVNVSDVLDLPSGALRPVFTFGNFNIDPQSFGSSEVAYSLADVFLVKIPELVDNSTVVCKRDFTYDQNELPAFLNPVYEWTSNPPGLFTNASTVTPPFASNATPGTYEVMLKVSFVTYTGRIPTTTQVQEVVQHSYSSSAFYTFGEPELSIKRYACVGANGHTVSNLFQISGSDLCIDAKVGPGLQKVGGFGNYHLVPNNSNIVTRSRIYGLVCNSTSFCSDIVVFPDLIVSRSRQDDNYSSCDPSNQDLNFVVGRNITEPQTSAFYRARIYKLNPTTLNAVQLVGTYDNSFANDFVLSQVPNLTGAFRVSFTIVDALSGVESECVKSFDYNTSGQYSVPLPTPRVRYLEVEPLCKGNKASVTVELENSGLGFAHSYGSSNGIQVIWSAREMDGTVTSGTLNDPTGNIVNFTYQLKDYGIDLGNFVDFTFVVTYDGLCSLTFSERFYVPNCCISNLERHLNDGYQLLGDLRSPNVPIIVDEFNPLSINQNSIVVSPIIVKNGGVLTIDNATVKFLGKAEYAFTNDPSKPLLDPLTNNFNAASLIPTGVTGAGIYILPAGIDENNRIIDIRITNSVLTNYCNDMWPGIQFWKECPDPALYPTVRLDIIVANSEFHNAYAFVSDRNRVGCSIPNSATPMEIRIITDKLDVIDCYKGVELLSNWPLNNVVLDEFHFLGSSDLQSPYSLSIANVRRNATGSLGGYDYYRYRSHSLVHLGKLGSTITPHVINIQKSTSYHTLYGLLMGAQQADYSSRLNLTYEGNDHRLVFLSAMANQNSTFPLLAKGVNVYEFGGDASDPSTEWHYSEQILDAMSSYGFYSADGSEGGNPYWNIAAFQSQGALTVNECTVIGNNPDRTVGALGLRNTLTVTKSNFQSLKHGVLSYDRTPSITNNLFADCKEAIYQASHGNNNGIPIDISMTLTCNRFERGNTFSGTKYGLWVDDNVPMENIGGPGTTSDPTLPNANVFPTAGSRPATRYDQNSPGAWVAPSDFVAVRFGTLATQYFAFANEFVGNYEPLQSSVQALATLDCFTAADPLAIPGPNRVEVCPSLGSSVVYFPLRIAPLTSLGSDVVREFRLYPNPVSQLLVLEHGADFVASVPVVADLTGKVLDVRWSRTDKGYQADMSSFAAGVYYVKVGHKSNKIIKQ